MPLSLATHLRTLRPLHGLIIGSRFSSTTGPRNIIARYTETFPLDLARVQSGRNVRLRDRVEQLANKLYTYDVDSRDGMVVPKEGEVYEGPNGCSLREPHAPIFHELLQNFRGPDCTIYVIPQGTPIPPSLTILNEYSSHFSLQCTQPIPLKDLNDELTEFINKHGRTMDMEQFEKEYPSK